MTAFDSPNTDPGHLGQPGTDGGLVLVSHVVTGQGTIRSPSPTCGPRPVPPSIQETSLSHVARPTALPSVRRFAFVVEGPDEAHDAGVRRIRRALKALLRSYRLRCVSVLPALPEDAALPPTRPVPWHDLERLSQPEATEIET
jgi:hypothetical protein